MIRHWIGGVVAVVVVCGCSFGTGSGDVGAEIQRDAQGRLDQSSQEFSDLAEGVVKDARDPGPESYCFNSTRWTHCFDGTGYEIRDHLNEATVDDPYLWRSKTSKYGAAVYQVKDGGRMFFHLRTADGVMYWIVYDPQGRDLPGWLRAQGFTDVGSYNENFAWAGRIVDQQKRHDFWIWVQARQSRIAEFEAKYPHLAAPELNKTPR